MKNLIIKKNYNLFFVESNKKIYELKTLGKLKDISIKVGDYVDIDKEKKIITNIQKRKTTLIRPSISNVDQCFIIMSIVNPKFSTLFLDKMLIILEHNNIKPIICISKLDIEKPKELMEYIKYYKKIGYKIIYNTQLKTIKKLIKHKISVFTGESGVGKSTLLNKIYDLNIKTGDISKNLKRGKNTTVNIELYKVKNGYIADTPGFSQIDCIDMNKYDIRDNYKEFKHDKCKYKDCMHIDEEDCYIKELVKLKKIPQFRYNNYKKIIGEL